MWVATPSWAAIEASRATQSRSRGPGRQWRRPRMLEKEGHKPASHGAYSEWSMTCFSSSPRPRRRTIPQRRIPVQLKSAELHARAKENEAKEEEEHRSSQDSSSSSDDRRAELFRRRCFLGRLGEQDSPSRAGVPTGFAGLWAEGLGRGLQSP